MFSTTLCAMAQSDKLEERLILPGETRSPHTIYVVSSRQIRCGLRFS
jgi:hypothetical protein